MMLVAEASSPLYDREEIDETVALPRMAPPGQLPVFLGSREYEIAEHRPVPR